MAPQHICSVQPPHCSCSLTADRASPQVSTFAWTPLAKPHSMQSLCLFPHCLPYHAMMFVASYLNNLTPTPCACR